MLTAVEEQYMKEIYNDLIYDMPDEEVLEMMEELEMLDLEDRFSFLINLSGKANPIRDHYKCYCRGTGCEDCLIW